VVEGVSQRTISPRGDRNFTIAASRPASGTAAIPTDVATCDDCLRELFDPGNRRYRHPFISCTQCGPRFTIVESVPYDRANTTMASFVMCEACRAEYEDPADRRFHAEPIACPDCGPQLSIPLDEAVEALQRGGIVAVKGIGGWHLACDATNDMAVRRLRERKVREDKPFAVMTAEPRTLVQLTPADQELVWSQARPIIVARRRCGAYVAASVAPGSPRLGVFTPYTPVHHVLVHDAGRPLVMTSGNASGGAIVIDDAEARRSLGDVADVFLGPIRRRCEDSVIIAGATVRRGRGLTPSRLALPVAAPEPVLAVGGELRSAFCIAVGADAHLSSHHGDLSSPSAWNAYLEDLELYRSALGAEPAVIAHDLHPDYRSTTWASAQDAAMIGVQHHHAHAAACLAEHGRTEGALAIVLDGTGYGTDGTLWGGELLHCDLADFERVAWLDPVALPGGEAAVRQPWRMAASYLERADRPVPWDRWALIRQALQVNAPLSSGAGRLLDAVAALLGVRESISYEGQAAMELELLAGDMPAAPYPCRVAQPHIVGADLVRAAHDDLDAGRPRAEIAAAVHDGLAEAFVAACAATAGPRTIALSGGCLANVRLARTLRSRLEEEGFEVLTHRSVPAGDGGLAFGQAAVAARRMSPCA
jgi:hydrogenase maturation protein HypF